MQELPRQDRCLQPALKARACRSQGSSFHLTLLWLPQLVSNHAADNPLSVVSPASQKLCASPCLLMLRLPQQAGLSSNLLTGRARSPQWPLESCCPCLALGSELALLLQATRLRAT